MEGVKKVLFTLLFFYFNDHSLERENENLYLFPGHVKEYIRKNFYFEDRF